MEMALRQLSSEEVRYQKISELGLDPNRFKITSIEVIAEMARRAAAFMCPCTTRTLRRAIINPLRGLTEDQELIQGIVNETLEAMISHGDLLEFPELGTDSSDGPKLLYAAPAAFVPCGTGTFIFVGFLGDQFLGLIEDVAGQIENVGHVRRLTLSQKDKLPEQLRGFGLLEIPFDKWCSTPKSITASDLVSKHNKLLESAGPSGEIPGLQILDYECDVSFYRGRWLKPKKHSGRYVARRKQAYGADLWSYVQLTDGEPQALIDLPLPGNQWRGCDEAWHLQLAIDASSGKPQRFKVSPESENMGIIHFFSPVPMWAQRRLDVFGEQISVRGSLFSYRITRDNLRGELEFIRNNLFLDQLSDEG